jgi:phage protein D/phage baseplate assembly protein gpV
VSEKYLAPDFHVKVNGDALAADISRNIVELSVTLAAGSIDALRLTLSNAYPELRWTHTADADLFAVGTSVVVTMGYVGEEETMFDGEITGITPSFPEGGAPTVEVEALNRLHRLQQRSDLITLQDATDGDMVAKIADASHLSAQVDDPGTVHPTLSTELAPHLQYLMERAGMVQRQVWVEGTTLHFAVPKAEEKPQYTLVWGRTRASATEGSLPLQSFSPSLDARGPVGSVVVVGQDPLTRERIEGKAGSGSGEEVLGGPATLVVADEPVGSVAEAEARAKAIYDARAAQFIRGSGATLGLPGLRPGTVVQLDGLGPRFNGPYHVTSATHSIGGSGYRTTFQCAREPGRGTTLLDALQPPGQAGGGGVTRIDSVATGVVTNAEDPEKLGRVRIKFPWLSEEQESPWARVAVPQRGMWMPPAVDDEVLVAFDRGDPQSPYVVGALWNQNAPPAEAGADGAAQVKVLRSRSGHVVRMDDTEGEEKIEIADGSGKSSIVISTKDGSITITSDADLVLESTGGKVVMKAAKGVEVASQDALKLEATGAVTIQGSTIDLN